MNRIAVFVDAGYLFAQGSRLIAGTKQRRNTLVLDEKAAVAFLTDLAKRLTGAGSDILRIYWYDGVSYRGESAEQTRIAFAENVKLRVGIMNRAGQQKGVDSLIVTDMIDLARNRAIETAVLLSGDEDVRIGVQVAQSYGVRVHLVGIAPSRGTQSKMLLREADTTTELDAGDIANFLAISHPVPAAVPSPAVVLSDAAVTSTAVVVTATVVPGENLERAVQAFAAKLQGPEISLIIGNWEATRGLPRLYDGRLLAFCREAIGAALDTEQKRAVRRILISMLQAKESGTTTESQEA